MKAKLKNPILIDHVVIAVAQAEFKTWKERCEQDPAMQFKVFKEDDWSWRACYLAFGDKLFLEIVEQTVYPARAGLALSGLGTETDLLSDLQAVYPDWAFETETANQQEEHWYDGYYASQTESELSFVWFMEYQGRFRDERQAFLSELAAPAKNEKHFAIVLSEKEYKDYVGILSQCQLSVVREQDVATVSDANQRSFQIQIESRPKQRVRLF